MAGLLEGMFDAGALPYLERTLAFTAARHLLILDNVANADTPGYRRKDLDVGAFEGSLREAQRRGSVPERPQEWKPLRSGDADLGGSLSAPGVLRHDGNDVDVERELALMGKNASRHNSAAGLLRKSFEQMRMAITERPT